jgi:two-component system, chemotaxis family, chemotaxis protein CheY
MRILIVDDSKAMRMMVRRVLGQMGLRDAAFEEAENGRVALDAITADPPDLVLSDWNMPEMTGIELLRALNENGLEVPFGFVTSESTGEMREQAILAGSRFMIAKPFTPDSFAEAINPVLEIAD